MLFAASLDAAFSLYAAGLAVEPLSLLSLLPLETCFVVAGFELDIMFCVDSVFTAS